MPLEQAGATAIDRIREHLNITLRDVKGRLRDDPDLMVAMKRQLPVLASLQ
jgi:hypothetical protein